MIAVGTKVLREVKSSGSGLVSTGLKELLYIFVLTLEMPKKSTVTENVTDYTHFLKNCSYG